VELAAALDHEAADAAGAQIVEDCSDVRVVADGNDLGEAAEPLAKGRGGRAGGVHELVPAVVPEPQLRVEVPAGGDRDLEGVLGLAACDPSGIAGPGLLVAVLTGVTVSERKPTT
jgi:hypothetical protein